MFSLDIAILTWITNTVGSWMTLNGMLTGFLPTAIIGVYGATAVNNIIKIKRGDKDVPQKKR